MIYLLNLAVDPDDLELLDVLETLADTRSGTVDNDSVLGSQSSRGRPIPCSASEEDHDSEGEENWHDKTLVAEEVFPFVCALSVYVMSQLHLINLVFFRMM